MSIQPKTIHVGVLVFPGCVASGAVLPQDVLRIANRLMLSRPAAARVRFEAHWVSARRGRSVAVGALSFDTVPAQAVALDALIVPGIDHGEPGQLTQALAELAPEQALLRRFAEGEGWLLSGCSGTCLVAGAGLLDGRRATTSWWLAGYCRRHFPQLHLHTDDALLQDGQHVTSAGVSSYFDLALWLVGHYGGADLQQMVARLMVMDARPAPQAPYAATTSAYSAADTAAAVLAEPGPTLLERARAWLHRRVGQAWTVAALARHCHTSTRTLLRRFREAMGVTPVQYVQQLRVERAKALLESTQLSLERITARCGYQDVSTLGRVFKRWTRLTPREYRERFGLRR